MNRNTFTKEDLKSGFVVKLRNGEHRMVMRAGGFTKILVNPSTGAWEYLSSWNNDLRSTRVYPATNLLDKKHDIMAVYGLVKGPAFYAGVLQAATGCRELLWERKEAKKLTVEEISKMLGYEVEIVAAH